MYAKYEVSQRQLEFFKPKAHAADAGADTDPDGVANAEAEAEAEAERRRVVRQRWTLVQDALPQVCDILNLSPNVFFKCATRGSCFAVDDVNSFLCKHYKTCSVGFLANKKLY